MQTSRFLRPVIASILHSRRLHVGAATCHTESHRAASPGHSAKPLLRSAVVTSACVRGRCSALALCSAAAPRTPHTSVHSSVSSRGMGAAAGGGGSDAEWRGVRQMGVHELKEILENEDLRDTVQLVDVREEWEAAEASVPGFTLLPLSRQQEWAGLVAQQLDPDKHTIVLCHHGMRSQMVANFLVSEGVGFTEVSNVAGGIDAYADVDPRTPRY